MVVSNRNLQTSRGPPFSGANRSFGGEKDLHERTYYGSWLVRGNFFRDKWNECRPWKTRNYVNKRIIYIYIIIFQAWLGSFQPSKGYVKKGYIIIFQAWIGSFQPSKDYVKKGYIIIFQAWIGSFQPSKDYVKKGYIIIFQAWIGSFQPSKDYVKKGMNHFPSMNW